MKAYRGWQLCEEMAGNIPTPY